MMIGQLGWDKIRLSRLLKQLAAMLNGKNFTPLVACYRPLSQMTIKIIFFETS